MARRIKGSRSNIMVQKPGNESGFPSREQILDFIEKFDGKAGKREIARAFGLKGNDKIPLKKILRELNDEGLVVKERKNLVRSGVLPNVGVYTIVLIDDHGDLIAEPARWDAKKQRPRALVQHGSIKQRNSGFTTPAPAVGDKILARLSKTADLPDGTTATITVIKILDKAPDVIMGVLRLKVGSQPLCLPVDKKQRELMIDENSIGNAKDGDLISIKLVKKGKYGSAKASICEVIGNASSEKAVSMIAILQREIPYIFPDNVLEEAANAKPATLNDREDWRYLPFITIDPATAKDHDDAVFAEPDTDGDNTGGYVVYVAIADVSCYIPSNGEIDREALKRGNSVYFPDRVIPMLPERISNNLCSLGENEDRPALAVRMVFDKKGKKLKHGFHRVMIRVTAGLSYTEAQSAIDGITTDKTLELLPSILRPLWQAYTVLQKGRSFRKPLELNVPERRILLKDNGEVDRVVTPERLDAHKLIEECMIQANVAAAETLEKHDQTLVYRVHDAPSLAKLESLGEFLKTLEIPLQRSGNMRPEQFNNILGRVEGTEHELLVNEVVLRSQSQAEYTPDNGGHFGLNLRRYAHFTSPIRRYADLIVHRALIGALGLGDDGLTKTQEAKLTIIAKDISDTERRAMKAERDTSDRLIAGFLSDRIGAEFEGRIAGVTTAGLFIKLAETGADGFIPISTLGVQYFIFVEEQRALVGERTLEVYRLGDAVRVRLLDAAPYAGALQFEMMTQGCKRPSISRLAQKQRKSSRQHNRGPGKRSFRKR
ncbi:MAG: ribonuclease R [Cohaesibacteraceae bacterium]|nr:ribonuclease R [Cohaesibacteraceae bacterium]